MVSSLFQSQDALQEKDTQQLERIRHTCPAFLILKIPYKLLRKLVISRLEKPCSLVPVGSSFLRLRQIFGQSENCCKFTIVLVTEEMTPRLPKF